MPASTSLQRETLAALLAAIRREQAACAADPSLLVSQIYPHLWWMAHDEVRQQHFRAVCAQAARMRTLAGPWLRRRDQPAAAPSLEMRLTADAGQISCLAFAGSLLAAGTASGTLLVWEIASGRVDSIAGAEGGVLALTAASEDRIRVCGATGAGEFDMRARRFEPFVAFDGVMTGAAFSGDLLAVGDAIGRIEIWDLAARMRAFGHAGRRVPIQRIGWSSDAELVVAVHSSGLVTAIDVSRHVARTRAPGGAQISAILAARAGRAVHVTRRDGSIARVEDLDLQEHPLATLEHESIVTALACPSGEILAACESGLVILLQFANGVAERRGQFTFDGAIRALAMDASGGLIAASDGRGCELHAIQRLSARPPDAVAAVTEPAVASGLGIVFGGRDGHAHLVRESGERVKIERGEARFAGPAAAAPLAPVWAAAHGTGNWRAWNLAAGDALGGMGAGGRVTALDVSPDGAMVVTGHDSGFAAAWDTETGAERGRQAIHDGSIEAVALHPNRPDLITAGTDRRIRAWGLRAGKANARDGEYIAFVTGSTNRTLAKVRFDSRWDCLLDSTCRALAFARDGLALYGACSGRIIELHPDDGRVLREFTGPERDWTDVAISRDGRFLAAAGVWGGICVWARESGAVTARYELGKSVVGLIWSGGRELAVTTRAGELALLSAEGVPPAGEITAPMPGWVLQRWESTT